MAGAVQPGEDAFVFLRVESVVVEENGFSDGGGGEAPSSLIPGLSKLDGVVVEECVGAGPEIDLVECAAGLCFVGSGEPAIHAGGDAGFVLAVRNGGGGFDGIARTAEAVEIMRRNGDRIWRRRDRGEREAGWEIVNGGLELWGSGVEEEGLAGGDVGEGGLGVAGVLGLRGESDE